MLKINQTADGTQISLTRGDTAILALNVKNADGTAYTVTNDDTVKVQVRKSPITDSQTSELVIDGDVAVTEGVPVWTISPAQSTLNAGTYYWDAQITTGSGYVCTYLSGTLVITAEVTTDGD